MLVLHPYPRAQRGASVGPERLAIVSHRCKTQRTIPALAYNLKAVATKQRWMLWDPRTPRSDRDDEWINVS